MFYGGYYGARGTSVEAYRASPVLQRHPADGGRHGGRPAAGGRHSGEHYGPQLGPEIYGFPHADGLPGFEGSIAAATLAPPLGGPAAAPEAAYLALLCHEGLADFRQAHSWGPQVVPAVETALRTIAQQNTPTGRELQLRLQAMARLKELAQSGIHFCVGLDLEPYGSFVSGLYTPTGDLDLSIEGHATWQDEAGRVQRVTVDGMERNMKVKFLRALASRIQAKRVCLGQVERILHARMPILKFRDSSGLDFDVGIGGSQALFKSAVLGLLAQYEWRFGALVRLVKLWARHYGTNDSTNGTLNSFALTLLVMFHLQTRSPAVLPPLCQLFGQGPGAARPMQEGAFPDWTLLTAACERLSHMSRQGGPSPAGANSETLLELLASFFALYEGLLRGGWAVPKGADADALRGVLRRVRVDTWAGRLRYECWDKEGYCCSVEDPFDSTDNCARTVRKEERLAAIVYAAARGRELLLDLETPDHAVRALQELFGRGGLHPNLLHDLLRSNGRAGAVQWIRPVDLIIPPRIQDFTNGRIPRAVHVNHQRRRGVDAPHAGLEQVQHQLELLTLASASQQHAQQVQQAQHAQQAEEPEPAAAAPPPAPLAAASAAVTAVPGLAPGAALPGSSSGSGVGGLQRAQRAPPPATTLSLQRLRQAMEPVVAEEAARLAEIERKVAEAAAASAKAKEEKKAAKRAAAKAAREAKAEERRRARAERGRSRSHSRASRASRTRSRRSATGGSRAASPALQAAQSAVAATVSNLGRASHLPAPTAGGTIDAATAAREAAVAALAGTAQAPAVEAAALAAQLLPPEAVVAAKSAAVGADMAATITGSTSGEPESATEPAAAEATRVAAAGGAAAAAASAAAAAAATAAVASEALDVAAGSGSEGGSRGKERRHGKNMKAGFKERQQRRAAAAAGDGSPSAAVAVAAPPGLVVPVQQQPQQPPAGAAATPQQQRDAGQGQAADGTEARRRQQRARGRGGRGMGQQQRAGAAEGAGSTSGAPAAPSGGQQGATTVVLRVLRRQGGRGRGGDGATQAPAAAAPAVT
ncbi:hypothetical protein ABPG75_003633 [Micractinium tetrahymenae]